jgi:N-acetylglutamate synthase-like GNAT family acetyltransferase
MYYHLVENYKEYITLVVFLISVFSFLISVYAARKSTAKANYSEQDKMYAELLKVGLENPDLRDPEIIAEKCKTDPKFAGKYNNYANMVWNCMETFYDLSTAYNTRRFFVFKRKTLDNTWLPVIREESRIHFNWLKQNQRLFKQSFRDYINAFNGVKIRQGGVGDVDDIYEFMKKLFPENELKSCERIRELVANHGYILHIAENKLLECHDRILGFSLVYQIPEQNTIWMDYFGINEAYQNSGYGTLLFNYVIASIENGKRNLFLELEIPHDKNPNAIENRRIRFYEHQGVRLLDIDYRLPLTREGTPMHLAYRPSSASMPISNAVLSEIITNIMNHIHSDQEFMPHIRDEILAKLKSVK